METGTKRDRVLFIIDLLKELDNICQELRTIDSSIKKETQTIYQKLLSRNRVLIDNDMEQYKSNLIKITSVNNDITHQINDWYAYSSDPQQKSSTLFPLHFLARKKRLKNNIKAANELISKLMIDNRFLKEKLYNHKLELEEQSVLEIEQCSAHKNYTNLSSTKERLYRLLRTLMPQIDGLCPLEIDIADLSPLFKKLETSQL